MKCSKLLGNAVRPGGCPGSVSLTAGRHQDRRRDGRRYVDYYAKFFIDISNRRIGLQFFLHQGDSVFAGRKYRACKIAARPS